METTKTHKTQHLNSILRISIRGFRGIKSVMIEDTRRVNVFLGNNNCGKSTVLEAIMILLGESKPSLPIELNASRNYYKSEKNSFSLFFHNLDTNTPVNIDASFGDGSQRNVCISYYERQKTDGIPMEELQNKGINTEPLLLHGLSYTYKDGDKEYRASVEVMDGESKKLHPEASEKYPVRKNATYIPPRYNFAYTVSSFNKIVKEKAKEDVLEILRNVEARIKDVVVVEDCVMVDVGLKKMIPINMLGDGVRKLFALIIALYEVKGGVLIMDEIDNGLFHKSMRTLWRALLKAAEELDVQLFASTHSMDSLLALKQVLSEELPEMQELVRIYTLRKDENDDVATYLYDYEVFNHVLNQEVDIR